MTRPHADDPTGTPTADVAALTDDRADIGASAYALYSGRSESTARKTEVINFTSEDVTLRQSVYEFISQPPEQDLVPRRRVRILGLAKKETLALPTMVNEDGVRLHALPTRENGSIAIELLMHLWRQCQQRAGVSEPVERNEEAVRKEIKEVVMHPPPLVEMPPVRTAMNGLDPDDPQVAEFLLTLVDLFTSYLLCVELPPEVQDEERCMVDFSYATSVHAAEPGHRLKRMAANVTAVSSASFSIEIAGLDDAASTHVQVRVPSGLRAARLSSSRVVVDLQERRRATHERQRNSKSRGVAGEGWATGGVAYWRPRTEGDAAAEQQLAAPGPQCNAVKDVRAKHSHVTLTLALETRGIFTAIVLTSLMLTAALGLLLWFYPTLHGDKEAQDVLVTSFLIAPSLVTSFVVANREPGVVSRVAQLPRSLLLVNLVLLLVGAFRTIADRGAAPDRADIVMWALSSAVSLWLLLTWVGARIGERRDSSGGLERSRWTDGPAAFVVPTTHGPRHVLAKDALG